jgi:hypothetical protein
MHRPPQPAKQTTDRSHRPETDRTALAPPLVEQSRLRSTPPTERTSEERLTDTLHLYVHRSVHPPAKRIFYIKKEISPERARTQFARKSWVGLERPGTLPHGASRGRRVAPALHRADARRV